MTVFLNLGFIPSGRTTGCLMHFVNETQSPCSTFGSRESIQRGEVGVEVCTDKVEDLSGEEESEEDCDES